MKTKIEIGSTVLRNNKESTGVRDFLTPGTTGTVSAQRHRPDGRVVCEVATPVPNPEQSFIQWVEMDCLDLMPDSDDVAPCYRFAAHIRS